MKRLLTGKQKIYFFIVFFIISSAASAQAMTWDFNDGTNQGWTVEFNTGGGSSAAFWNSSVNYSGDPALGRAPVYGPLDDGTDDIGAISAFTDDMATEGYTISSFASPVFSGLAMNTISAQFIVSGQESGIDENTEVWGQVGYTREGDPSFFFSSLFPLDTAASGPGSVYPLWTQAVMAVAAGDLVTQVFVNIRVDRPTILGGTRHWVDQVVTDDGTVPPDTGLIPEPNTMMLLGLGLLVLARAGRKN